MEVGLRNDEYSKEMLNSSTPIWRLAYTRPRMEHTAVSNLEGQGFEAYLPLFKICRRTAQGLQTAFEPMFPRYVFLRPTSPRISFATIASTRGIVSLVRFAGEPAKVSSHTLEQIRAFEAQRSQAELEAISPIQPGARVRLRKGGMQGIEGLVVSVARQRVTFLLELLGRETQVTVEHNQLELA